jgi:hypothetical protein
MRLNETCNMIIEQEYIENVVFSQPDGLQLPEGREFEDEITLKNDDSFTFQYSCEDESPPFG